MRVGELLKQEREKRGLSLHEVGLSLKINPKVIAAIESEDLERLPAKTFLRGFVKSYAHFLKLNADEVMGLFQTQYGPSQGSSGISGFSGVSQQGEEDSKEVSHPEEGEISLGSGSEQRASQGSSQASDSSRGRSSSDGATIFPLSPGGSPSGRGGGSSTWMQPLGGEDASEVLGEGRFFHRGRHFLVVVLILCMIIFVYRMIEKYQREKPRGSFSDMDIGGMGSLNGSGPVGGSQRGASGGMSETEGGPHEDLKKDIQNSLSGVVNPSPNSGSSGGGVLGASPTPVLTPLPTLGMAAISGSEKMVTPTVAVTPKPSLPLAPPLESVVSGEAFPRPVVTPSPSPSPRPLEVILEAHGSLTLKYRFTNEGLGTLQLKEGEFQIFKSRSGLRLEISDGGMVSIIVNGRDLGTPGQLGQSIKLSYP